MNIKHCCVRKRIFPNKKNTPLNGYVMVYCVVIEINGKFILALVLSFQYNEFFLCIVDIGIWIWGRRISSITDTDHSQDMHVD